MTIPMTSPDFQLLLDLAGDVPLVHDFGRVGWEGFRQVVMTADGAQGLATSVNALGAGVVTATAAAGGNYRACYLREGTTARDSEIESVIVGPSGWEQGTCQQGHLHRVREIEPGVWEGIGFWTSDFGADYGTIHVNAVRFDGTDILQGTAVASAADLGYIDRSARVVGALRFTFFGLWINEYTLQQPRVLDNVVNGELVSVVSMGDATFNESNVAVLNSVTNGGTVQVIDPVSTTPVAYFPTGSGLVVPQNDQKYVVPYRLRSRVVGGDGDALVGEHMRWLPFEARPAWSSKRVQRVPIAPSVGVPQLAHLGGESGLWAGHFLNGKSGAWDAASFQKLP